MIDFEEGKQLFIDALDEFQGGIINEEELEKFLRRQKLVKPDTQAYCASCGKDTGKEFALIGKPHYCRERR